MLGRAQKLAHLMWLRLIRVLDLLDVSFKRLKELVTASVPCR